MYKEIEKCPICGNDELSPIINLGVHYLTGVFPRNKKQKLTRGPLELVKCQEDRKDSRCGLVHLRHSFDFNEMYGDNYGYRSGINRSMVEHLRNKVRNILKIVHLSLQDMVIDIGSNDSTLLQAYPEGKFILVGIDPTGKKFKKYYPKHIHLIPHFFDAKLLKDNFGSKRAKVITSIAMFYDLESPLEFMRQVHEVLADDGIWVFEQSYMPAMLEMNAYDIICHEHLEYYRLKQIKWMTDKIGFKIIDIEFNNVNGGSFSITAAKSDSGYRECADLIMKVLHDEKEKGLGMLKPYVDFKQRVFEHRDKLLEFIRTSNKKGKKIFGYGASTKGNVILQFCRITDNDIPFIAEVNEDKFGCYTPGTYIPIISELEAKNMQPDYFMVLPWHFKDNIIAREKKYLEHGGKLFFPLPKLEVV